MKREVLEHGDCDEREDTPKDVATEGLGRERRTGVAVVGVSQVVEGSQVDGVDAHRRAADGQRGDDPGDGAELGPAEPEEADGEEHRLDAGEIQASFGTREVDAPSYAAGVLDVLPGGGEVAAQDAVLVDGEHGGDDCRGAHGAEDGVGLLQREVVRV